MGINLLFGTIETREETEDGKVKVTEVRKRNGIVYSTTIRYADVVKPRTRADILSAFVEFIDTINPASGPVAFKLKPNQLGGGWTAEREWTEKK